MFHGVKPGRKPVPTGNFFTWVLPRWYYKDEIELLAGETNTININNFVHTAGHKGGYSECSLHQACVQPKA